MPTLMWFVDGKPSDYDGRGREPEQIVEWVLRKAGPPSKELSCDGLEQIAKSDKFSVVYFGNTEDAAYNDLLVGFARKDLFINFYHQTDSECAAKFDVPFGSLTFFRQFETTKNVY